MIWCWLHRIEKLPEAYDLNPTQQAKAVFAARPLCATMQTLHDRMPVMLEEEHWPIWLGERAGEPTGLMRPADDGLLHLWAVSRAVNSVRNNSPDLLDRIDDPHAPPPSDAPPGNPA